MQFQIISTTNVTYLQYNFSNSQHNNTIKTFASLITKLFIF